MSYTAADQALIAQSNPDRLVMVARDWRVGLAGFAIVVGGLAAYSNSFGGAFAYDDLGSIAHNQTIQQGWWTALNPPPGGFTVSGRPLVNLSLAINYRLGGFNLWGYHAANLTIQLLAGLTLFGLVRRTLEQPLLRGRFGTAALPLAFVVALLWTVHPLQTESVTYIVQRAESLMGLFYLLTLYCFVRGLESSRGRAWHTLSVAACMTGMFCKEVMVSAPLMVLLYDRTFIAGTFNAAWRQRWKFYAALACAWVPLAVLVAQEGSRGNSTGMDGAVGVREYAQSQFSSIIKYIGLSVWPHPLTLDYGPGMEHNPWVIVPCAVAVVALLGGTLYALLRRPKWGFLGMWFFAILAPSSSVVPVAEQAMAEHRMYLPLVALEVLMVVGLYSGLGRRSHVAGLALALGLGVVTFERNRDYRTGFSIWANTLQESPDNPRAETGLGAALEASGRLEEALARYKAIVKIRPDSADGYYDLATVYLEENRTEEARDAYAKALQLSPDLVPAHINLGILDLKTNRAADAIPHFSAAIHLQPDFGEAYLGLGDAFFAVGRINEAITQDETALRLMPDNAAAHSSLGETLAQLHRFNDAAVQFEEVLRLDPNYPHARENLAAARQLGQNQPSSNGPMQ